MPGLPGTVPAPDLPPGPRLALVVATTTYADPGLRRLRAPARDATDLAEVLGDPDIGGFSVTPVIDKPAQEIRLAVEGFLADRGTQDLLLIYLSCHGLIDAHRRLFFAATDTRKDRLGSTGVESAWVLDQLEHCRARRQILILDSCFSGAFARGAKGDADLGLGRFAGQGRGRVVLTASNANEYSFEGEPADAAVTTGSVFTSALVAGLRTGAADTDHDGHISVDDAYAYTFDQVQAAGAAQTPQRWFYGAEGKIVLARSPAGRTVQSSGLPDSLRAGLESPYPGIRIGAVGELGEWLSGDDPSLVLAARHYLGLVAGNDIPRVADAARALLAAEKAGAVEAPAGPAKASQPEPAASRPRPVASQDEQSQGKRATAGQRNPAASQVGRQQERPPSPEPRMKPSGNLPSRAAQVLSGHTAVINAMAFSPNGRLLATGAGAMDNTVRLWDPNDGRHLATLRLEPGPDYFDARYFTIRWMAFSRDGRQLATSGDSEHSWWLWDLGTGRPERKILHRNNAQAAAFRPDGRSLPSRRWTGRCGSTIRAPARSGGL